MSQIEKNILIFAASSDIGKELTDILLKNGASVYATSRREFKTTHPRLKTFILDLTKESDINLLFEKFSDTKFDAIVNFQGIAICSPVETLKSEDLKKQLEVSVFSLLYVLKNAKRALKPNGLVINISSMASFGIFPFLSPYSMSKASADILLNCFELETGIKTVSVKPGVVGTKFWQYCVDANLENLQGLPSEYETTAGFLKANALKNSSKGLKPKDVANLIFNIIKKKKCKSSYLIGKDSVVASIAALFKGRILNSIIRFILKKRIGAYQNGK